MSSYITRWCPRHGEWDDDVDCPSECPECLELGIAESQLNFKKITESTARIVELEAENTKLRACVKAADGYFEADANAALPIEEAKYWRSYADTYYNQYRAARKAFEALGVKL